MKYLLDSIGGWIRMIWSDVAIDYSAGFDILDPTTDKIYTEEEAKKLPKYIKKRLINHPRKIGCVVEDI